MGKSIAVAGKGGTGKTTLTGLLLRYLAEKVKRPILAVDADANANLSEVLGVEVPGTIGELREGMKTEVPAGMTKEAYMEYNIQKLLVETGTYDLLVMGLPEGAGCYCYANALCKKFIDFMINEYDYLVMDNEAGLEHLSRLLTKDIDVLLVISDPSLRGIRTAGRIKELIDKLNLNIKKLALIVNRAPEGEISPEARQLIDSLGLELAGIIPDDPLIAQFDRQGKATVEVPAEAVSYCTLREIMETIFPLYLQ
ncbi:MAG: AAA family ATPase [Deltaproteobacteria bacterium]|nr:AAA family ATPase [Candidatus Anaeroferrophillus wilburensis]MBN2888864.1 AAA family ATPase [Deltaproteobacteria bacterium]